MNGDTMLPSVHTREDAERYAAAEGISLTARDLQEIEKRIQADRDAKATQSGAQRDLVTRFVDSYLKLLKAIEGASEVLFTMLRALILAFGIPTVLLLLLVVEQQRVVEGMVLFELNDQVAAFGAWAVVILNLVLEFTIEYTSHRNGLQAEGQARFSLRIAFERLKYMLGLGANWKAQSASPADPYRRLLRLVTFAILALALAGSMRQVIENTPGTWYEALRYIVLKSTLGQLMTWIGGLLFAGVAVFAVQALSSYIASRCADIIDNMEARRVQEQEVYVDTDAIAVQYILAKVSSVKSKRDGRQNGKADFLARRA